MAKTEKLCPHTNTVQSGDEKEVRTYCTDCNELVLTVRSGYTPFGKPVLTINGIKAPGL